MTAHQKTVLASIRYACEYQGDDEPIASLIRANTSPETRDGFIKFVEQELKLGRGSWAYEIGNMYRDRQYVEIVRKFGGLFNKSESAYAAKCKIIADRNT